MEDGSIEEFIQRLASSAEAFGIAAKVGGMETAGAVVSFLAEHPDWIGAFIKGGVTALPSNFVERGTLTWHAANGEVVSPEFARRARIVSKLAQLPKAA